MWNERTLCKSTFGVLALSVVLAGCTKEDPDPFPEVVVSDAGSLRLVFQPYWGNVPFDKFNVYQNAMDYRVQVQEAKFYLGDLIALNAGAGEPVSDIAFLNVVNGPEAVTFAIAPGDYTGLSFGVGVPYGLNHSDPSNYANEHPLSVSNGMYWTWNSGYRFVVFDGRFDSDPNGTAIPPPFGYSIHSGRDTCYLPGSINADFQVVKGEQTTLNIKVDISRFFYTSNDTLDLATGDSQMHGEAESLPRSVDFTRMVAAAITPL